MQALVIAAMVALLAVPAYAQTFEEKMKKDAAAREAADRGYRPAADRIPDQKPNIDPWATVRGAEQPANKPKKPAGAK